jgi:isopropylmalate/homocitrate/citramalate synthase
MTTIEIFDSTLRDGAQGEGISFSVGDKLGIVRTLDAFGVDYIEAGNPGSNPKDIEFFHRVRELTLVNARLSQGHRPRGRPQRAFPAVRGYAQRGDFRQNLGSARDGGAGHHA